MDVPTAADAVANFQQIMMDRFKFMEQMQVDFIKLLAWAYRNMRKNIVIELLGRQL